MNKVIVAIPTHKEKLSLGEQVSLAQVAKVLHKYPQVFVVPKSSSVDFAANYPEFGIARVKDEWFGTIRRYTDMCLSEEFYELFSNYEYMLIYQLDAFVFSDRLAEFCSMGYDYIGSPWPWLRRHKSRGGQSVGIGGFSLRKITSCIKMVKHREEICKESGVGKVFETAEDRFFGYCGKSPQWEFAVPPVSVAKDFSLDINVGHYYYKLSQDSLPFGCHGWTKKSQFELWRPFIEPRIDFPMDLIAKEVYSGKGTDYNPMIWDASYLYFLDRIMRRDSQEVVEKAQNYLPLDATYIFWGNGAYCDRALNLCRFLLMQIACIYDKQVKSPAMVDGMIIKPPDEQEILSGKYKILITTKKYESEIRQYLEGKGLRFGKEFFSFMELQNVLVQAYYGELKWLGWHTK